MGYRSPVLVGRDNELRIVEEAIRAAGQGRGGCIFIVGDGGIGKSRIASAAADLGFAAGTRLMRGRSSAIGPLVPARSLTEAVLSLLRAGTPIDLAALGPYQHVLGRLVPDMRSSAADQSDSLVILGEAILRLATLAGQDGGCLMTLDDLQDADSETLGVVEYLADNLARHPVLLLGAIRAVPCPARNLAQAAAQRGSARLIELDPLDRQQIVAMAGACLDIAAPSVPEPVVDLLWAGSAGNPFLVEDLLSDMIDSGLLVRAQNEWRMQPDAKGHRPDTFMHSVRRRIDQVAGPTRELIMAGALLGVRFPLPVAQKIIRLPDRELLRQLQGTLAAHLVVPDEQTPDWYTFKHPLIREAVLNLLGQQERADLARRAAEAVTIVYPDLAGEWCQVAAALWLDAGEPDAAGRLFAEAGRRSLAQGAVKSAVALLEKAWEHLRAAGASARADTLESLITALSEAGLVERALELVEIIDQVDGILDAPRQARLNTQLAWAAMLSGNTVDGVRRVQAARALLGSDPPPGDLARVDVVAAHLELDLPGPDRPANAELMARRAADVAETVELPIVACQAWQLLGALIRRRDPDEATVCLERSRVLAVRHGLPIWEIHALVRLGNDDALRDGSTARLELALSRASSIGAVIARYQALASIALQTILHGQFDRAAMLIDEILTDTGRLKLVELTEYVTLLRAVLAGHRGSRKEMDLALAQLRHDHGDLPQHRPRVYGLARTFCALLEEDRDRAGQEIALAISAEDANPNTFHLTGRSGLQILLIALSDNGFAVPMIQAPTACRWDHQFALFGQAVLAGRGGDPAFADALTAEAVQVGAPYEMARNLGLRMLAEAGLRDGWGTPVEWLRTAEEYFHRAEIPAVAAACRALLRTAGVRVAQRRTGIEVVPAALRSVGVTIREFEVLRLISERLGNREIAKRLHLSPRTIERYVSNLIAKTGMPNRIALSDFGYRPDP